MVSGVVSHWVVQHHVLFGQLQQHGVVEELADADVLAQTLRRNERSLDTGPRTRVTQQRRLGKGGGVADLAPSGLDHELPGQVGGRLGLQRSDHDAFIQRVSGNDLKEDTDSRTLQETGACYLVQDGKSHLHRIIKEGC